MTHGVHSGKYLQVNQTPSFYLGVISKRDCLNIFRDQGLNYIGYQIFRASILAFFAC